MGSTGINFDNNSPSLNQDELKNTYTEIYVNIARTTSASSILDGNGVIVCNNITNTGSITNPLNLRQFREYLKYDHELDQTFYLSGAASFDIKNSSIKGLLGDDVLLETPHSGRKIKITNWKNEVKDIQQPWTLTVNSTDDVDVVWIITNNDDVEISNGEIEVSGNPNRLHFGIKNVNEYNITPNTEGNVLKLIDNKFYANKSMCLACEEIHTFEFLNYNDIMVNHTIFNNRATSGSLLIRNDFIEKCNATFLNSIFVNIEKLVGSPDLDKWIEVTNNSNIDFDDYRIYLNTNRCVFTAALSALGNNVDTRYYNLYNPVGLNQFEWSAASACSEDLMSLSQELDFNYINADWITISLSGTPVNDYNNLGNFSGTDYVFTEKRDGLGPLTFIKIPDVAISATTSASQVDETVTFVNRDASYDNTYNPSRYLWYFDYSETSATSATTSGSVDYVYTYPNIYNIDVKVYSYNNWYTVGGETANRVIASGANFDLHLFVTSSDCFDEFLVSATSATVFDRIILSAVNVCDYSDAISCYKTWGHDFADSYTNMEFFDDYGSGDFDTSGGTYSADNRYMSSGTYYVYFSAKQVDGQISNQYKILNIYPHTRNIYYVNLSEKHDEEVWWEYDTIMDDDFESGVISAAWGIQFRESYNVVNMWDEKVASLNSATGYPVPLFFPYDYIDYNFNIEFSFNRQVRDSIPKFIIESSASENVLKVEWDYENEKIDVYFFNDDVKSIKYDLLKYGFVKDLRCSNSLRVLKIKIINDPPSGDRDGTGLKLFYSMDGTQWIDSEIFDRENNDYIDDDYKRLSLLVVSDNNTGFGYLKLQSKCGLPYVNGSITYPMKYDKFKSRVEINGDGGYNDKYLCKNYRKISDFIRVDPLKYFEIDAWDLSNYGPWMLVVDVGVEKPYDNIRDSYDMDKDISFAGTRLSNGILYSLKSNENDPLPYTPNLRLSFAYDMFIVWNGIPNDHRIGSIRVEPSKWIERDNLYKDFVGCTLKAEVGFIDYTYAPSTYTGE